MTAITKLALSAFAVASGTLDLLAYKNYEKSEKWQKVGDTLLSLGLVTNKRNLIIFAACSYLVALLVFTSIFFGR